MIPAAVDLLQEAAGILFFLIVVLWMLFAPRPSGPIDRERERLGSPEDGGPPPRGRRGRP